MERIKYIIIFFHLALIGAGWIYLDFFFGHFSPTLSLVLAGPAALIMGIGGFFYQIYMLIYDAWHRSNTSAPNATDKTTTPRS